MASNETFNASLIAEEVDKGGWSDKDLTWTTSENYIWWVRDGTSAGDGVLFRASDLKIRPLQAQEIDTGWTGDKLLKQHGSTFITNDYRYFVEGKNLKRERLIEPNKGDISEVDRGDWNSVKWSVDNGFVYWVRDKTLYRAKTQDVPAAPTPPPPHKVRVCVPTPGISANTLQAMNFGNSNFRFFYGNIYLGNSVGEVEQRYNQTSVEVYTVNHINNVFASLTEEVERLKSELNQLKDLSEEKQRFKSE